MRDFGRAAGLAFQIADDILDVTQTSEQLGKTAGKDLAAEKVTYPALFGLAKAEEMAAELIRNGLFGAGQLRPTGRHSEGNRAIFGGTEEVERG